MNSVSYQIEAHQKFHFFKMLALSGIGVSSSIEDYDLLDDDTQFFGSIHCDLGEFNAMLCKQPDSTLSFMVCPVTSGYTSPLEAELKILLDPILLSL